MSSSLNFYHKLNKEIRSLESDHAILVRRDDPYSRIQTKNWLFNTSYYAYDEYKKQYEIIPSKQDGEIYANEEKIDLVYRVNTFWKDQAQKVNHFKKDDPSKSDLKKEKAIISHTINKLQVLHKGTSLHLIPAQTQMKDRGELDKLNNLINSLSHRLEIINTELEVREKWDQIEQKFDKEISIFDFFRSKTTLLVRQAKVVKERADIFDAIKIIKLCREESEFNQPSRSVVYLAEKVMEAYNFEAAYRPSLLELEKLKKEINLLEDKILNNEHTKDDFITLKSLIENHKSLSHALWKAAENLKIGLSSEKKDLDPSNPEHKRMIPLYNEFETLILMDNDKEAFELDKNQKVLLEEIERSHKIKINLNISKKIKPLSALIHEINNHIELLHQKLRLGETELDGKPTTGLILLAKALKEDYENQLSRLNAVKNRQIENVERIFKIKLENFFDTSGVDDLGQEIIGRSADDEIVMLKAIAEKIEADRGDSKSFRDLINTTININSLKIKREDNLVEKFGKIEIPYLRYESKLMISMNRIYSDSFALDFPSMIKRLKVKTEIAARKLLEDRRIDGSIASIEEYVREVSVLELRYKKLIETAKNSYADQGRLADFDEMLPKSLVKLKEKISKKYTNLVEEMNLFNKQALDIINNERFNAYFKKVDEMQLIKDNIKEAKKKLSDLNIKLFIDYNSVEHSSMIKATKEQRFAVCLRINKDLEDGVQKAKKTGNNEDLEYYLIRRKYNFDEINDLENSLNAINYYSDNIVKQRDELLESIESMEAKLLVSTTTGLENELKTNLSLIINHFLNAQIRLAKTTRLEGDRPYILKLDTVTNDFKAYIKAINLPKSLEPFVENELKNQFTKMSAI